MKRIKNQHKTVAVQEALKCYIARSSTRQTLRTLRCSEETHSRQVRWRCGRPPEAVRKWKVHHGVHGWKNDPRVSVQDIMKLSADTFARAMRQCKVPAAGLRKEVRSA